MKKIFAVLLSAIIAAGVFAACSKPEEETTTTTAPVTEATTESTNQATTETTETSTEPTTEDPFKFIEGGYWYLFDDDKEECYAVSFEGNGKASIGYFSSENVEGEDAEYYKGSATYNAEGDTVSVNVSVLSFESNFDLIVNNKKLYYGKKELKRYDKLSLDYVFEHFYES